MTLDEHLDNIQRSLKLIATRAASTGKFTAAELRQLPEAVAVLERMKGKL